MSTIAKLEHACDQLRLLFSRPSVVLVSSVVVIVWRLSANSPADPDLFARVGMGRLVEKLGGVPLQDPFAFTAKLPMWIDHEWLSGVVFYQVGARWGDAGLVLLKLLIAAWTCLLLVRASMIYAPRAAGRAPWAVLCILEASFLWGSTVRCQVYTYFFLALTYYAFAQYRVNAVSRYLALIPLASVALVNMHGGYALEVLVLWILTVSSFAQRKSWKLLAIASALSSLAPAATPYGFQAFSSYLVHALSMERPTISEWAALYQDPAPFIRTVLIATPLLAGVVLALRRRDWDLTALALLGFSFYCGFKHVRFVGFAMLTAVVFGAAYFSHTVEIARSKLKFRMVMLERSLAVVGAVMFVFMTIEIGAVSRQPQSWRLNMRAYPVEAVEWLRSSGATGKLLVDFNNGSFALWRLYPRFLISMDGRYEEVYSSQALADATLAFSPHTPDGLEALNRIAPTHILFDISARSSDRQLALPPEWREVYRDQRCVLYSTLMGHPMPDTPVPNPDDLWTPLF